MNTLFLYLQLFVLFLFIGCNPADVTSSTYTQAGSGTSYGVLNLNTTALPTDAGSFTSITLSLNASDVCSDKTIFGLAGTAACGGFSMIVPSNMSRTIGVSQLAMSNEVSGAGYRQIPDIMKDDDGCGDYNGYGNPSPVIKASRPTTECGTTQTTVASRIADCLLKNPVEATWNGETNGIGGEATWKLVTRTASAYEVWRDERTGFLWSDSLASDTWCRASGNAQPIAPDNDSPLMSACNPLNPYGYGAQDASPTSLCAEVAGLNTPNSYDEFKGGMRLAASGTGPSIKWRLPTKNDWLQAEIDGVRFVLPNIENYFWSATIVASDRNGAWAFDGVYGSTTTGGRASNYSVRCLGR